MVYSRHIVTSPVLTISSPDCSDDCVSCVVYLSRYDVFNCPNVLTLAVSQFMVGA
ncbi:MAG: hypothetical protein NTV63_04540 [Candidatus Woesearchaeota archaeon]|nr:hypothetical protein [Candidatus Woesearchaeota archaeon]